MNFAFATAKVSLKSYHSCEEGQRVTKGAYICSVRNALRSVKPERGNFVLFKAPDHVIFDDFKLWAVKDGLQELTGHALL